MRLRRSRFIPIATTTFVKNTLREHQLKSNKDNRGPLGKRMGLAEKLMEYENEYLALANLTQQKSEVIIINNEKFINFFSLVPECARNEVPLFLDPEMDFEVSVYIDRNDLLSMGVKEEDIRKIEKGTVNVNARNLKKIGVAIEDLENLGFNKNALKENIKRFKLKQKNYYLPNSRTITVNSIQIYFEAEALSVVDLKKLIFLVNLFNKQEANKSFKDLPVLHGKKSHTRLLKLIFTFFRYPEKIFVRKKVNKSDKGMQVLVDSKNVKDEAKKMGEKIGIRDEDLIVKAWQIGKDMLKLSNMIDGVITEEQLLGGMMPGKRLIIPTFPNPIHPPQKPLTGSFTSAVTQFTTMFRPQPRYPDENSNKAAAVMPPSKPPSPSH